jgi:hypothetical protein
MTKDSAIVASRVMQAFQPIDCVDNIQIGPNNVGVFILGSKRHTAVPNEWSSLFDVGPFGI